MEWKLVYDAGIWLHKNWAKVRLWVTPLALASGTKPIPKEPFRIVLDTSNPPWWHMGERGDSPATQIHACYYVTNITDEKILVVGCKLKPEGAGQIYDLQHTVRQMRDGEEANRRGRRLLGGLVKTAGRCYTAAHVLNPEVQLPAILEMEG